MPPPVLAGFGIIFVLAVFVCVVYFAVRIFGSRGKSRHSAPVDPVAGTGADAILELRAGYDRDYQDAGVPGTAAILRVITNSYTPVGAAAKHYCWVQYGMLRMFPLWESVTAGKQVAEGVYPREWRIPVDHIICYAVEHELPSKYTVLQFRVDPDILTLSFGEEAARVFGELIPEKDYSRLSGQLYPKSSRNISDIQEGFRSLKKLRDSKMITDDEYAAKKKEMLILM